MEKLCGARPQSVSEAPSGAQLRLNWLCTKRRRNSLSCDWSCSCLLYTSGAMRFCVFWTCPGRIFPAATSAKQILPDAIYIRLILQTATCIRLFWHRQICRRQTCGVLSWGAVSYTHLQRCHFRYTGGAYRGGCRPCSAFPAYAPR